MGDKVTYAFTFDARFCSGCKACQAACKDKNNLPTGVLWRRVVEVSGGTWGRASEAWSNTVFAYNLSIACNHCMHPKCAGVCPANAYVVRQDGIVILDEKKCTGCGYCVWACPYEAPQYNSDAGVMTKCNLCFDQIDQGLSPACVAACPLRVLEYRDVTSTPLPTNLIRLWESPPESHPYPLPEYSHTQPRLAIRSHGGMTRAEKKSIANLEEIQPRHPSRWEDLPLLLFTLLAQFAVGGFWGMLWMFPEMWQPQERQPAFRQLLPLLLVGLSLGAGTLASLTHLGKKQRALVALRNLRRSWLSREILFLALFGAGWLFTVLEYSFAGQSSPEIMAATATLGLGLVYSMAQVYRLRTVPAWNTWRTNAGFVISAFLLGQSAMMVLWSWQSEVNGSLFVSAPWTVAAGGVPVLLILQLMLKLSPTPSDHFHRARTGSIVAAMALAVTGLRMEGTFLPGISTVLFGLVLLEEILGRWSLYRARTTGIR